ncbi:MAG: sigma-54-dependent Fis family transcriptional regulator [Deltaproteobacteria bacterium]|nr:sigma-54-dependent Fis family transcriptional regulator [Deltaproteobacteria bacterium]
MKQEKSRDKDGGDNTKGRILVVDDEQIALKNLRRILEKAGYEVSTFTNPLRALKRLEEYSYDLIISDLKMPYLDGLSLLNQAKHLAPRIEVILITGYASIDGAIQATREGAFHYLAKPFLPDQVRHLVAEALNVQSLSREAQGKQVERESLFPSPAIIGKSPKIELVKELIRQVAPAGCNVLITGESGTGKELVARAIHAQSTRARGAFVAFNCGALSEELIANELFGHEKGAFTGASSRRMGLLETANRGTVFLDEIGDMPLSMQVKLLRVIQERELIRVGDTHPIPLDLRILAATAQDLKMAAAEGTFRQDLYFRLNVVNISLPGLRERKKDIPLLAYHLLGKINKRLKKDVRGISAETMGILEDYAFPGNVRELENIIERAVAVCQGEIIQVRDLPPDLPDIQMVSYNRPSGTPLNLEELEEDYIRHVLKLTGGVRTEAAKILGIDRASLWRKMKKFGPG